MGTDATSDSSPSTSDSTGSEASSSATGSETTEGTETGDETPPQAVAVACGHTHTCALADTGEVKCWGNNAHGQLGQADTVTIGDDETPATIHSINLGGPAVAISAGNAFTCAVMQGGSLRCWGHGGYGNLGLGNTDNIGDDEPPVAAAPVDVGGSVVQVATGELHACALLDTGGVRCWGDGLLGYADGQIIGDDETPASAGDVPLGGAAIQIAAGRSHTCALLDTGALRCWGNGFAGELGYGNVDDIGDDETPATAGDVPVGVELVDVDIGYAHTCARTITDGVRCWGDGQVGALGQGNTNSIGDDEFPASVPDVDIGGPVLQLALGYNGFTCARLELGSLRCFGNNFFGCLGYGHGMNIGDDESPASAGDVDLGGVVVDVSAGDTHVCAVLDDGSVRCWGDGSMGALGYANTDRIGDDETPASVGAVEVW